MRKRLLRIIPPSLSLLALNLFVGCACSAAEAPAKPEPPIEVKIIHPIRGPITRSIILPGEVKPYQQATLYAKVAGYLKSITVDKGDPVKKGDLIAELEVPEIAADLAKYRAEVVVAELDYKRLSESLTKAPDLVTPQSVDNAKAKLDVARANVVRSEALLNYARISAPFSGIITKRMVDPGAFIPAATSGGTAQNAALVTLSDFNTVRVQVAVPEIEAGLVAKDQPVSVSVDGLPGRKWEGKVTRFAYALDDATKTMLAEIELPNPKLELRPGMYAVVKIGIERKADVLLLPREAVTVEKAGAFVFTLKDGHAKRVSIKTGFGDGANFEVVSGISAEDVVILPGKRALSDGQAVKPVEAK